jgi:hypothetical protein
MYVVVNYFLKNRYNSDSVSEITIINSFITKIMIKVQIK